MSVQEIIHEQLSVSCPNMHRNRLQSVIDVATGLQKSQNLSITAIGRQLSNETSIKHRIKKVDRLLGNQHLYNEVSSVYEGLSSYVLKYIHQDKSVPLIIDLCYMKDTHAVQMFSAEVALKGRSLPVYREVFEQNQLKNRAPNFIHNLQRCIPKDKQILVIMDAGFGDDWFEAISDAGWFWLVRARGKKFIQLSSEHDWVDARELYSLASSRAKSFDEAHITKRTPRSCRVVIKGPSTKKATSKAARGRRGSSNSANGNYRRSAQEPWILATNLPSSYTTTQIVNAYKKRMQIEESFRDIKSHQFGLSARYIRTISIYRWSIAMLLAAIVQVTLWLIGVIGHHQGMQSYFQANTVRDKKVFSYFYLGQLIVEHDKLDDVMKKSENLLAEVEQELLRDW